MTSGGVHQLGHWYTYFREATQDPTEPTLENSNAFDGFTFITKDQGPADCGEFIGCDYGDEALQMQWCTETNCDLIQWCPANGEGLMSPSCHLRHDGRPRACLYRGCQSCTAESCDFNKDPNMTSGGVHQLGHWYTYFREATQDPTEPTLDPVVTSVYKKTDCRFDYSSTVRSAGDYGAHLNTPKTLEECEALCDAHPECASFVVDQMGGGKCHLRTECPLVNEDCIDASSWNFINYVKEDCEASAPTSPPDNFPSDAWEQISDADGQYCVSMYNPHLNSNCRQACMDDNVCGAYTQYRNGWCQLIYSECTEWRNAADTSAISWRKQGQSLPDVWEQISDADGQYCVSMYNPHSNSNCRQACMDDNVCGAYTQYRNGWCQLIASECTEWRNAADTSAISWRKPGQQSKEQIKLDAESTAREYSMVEEAVANSLLTKGFAFVGALSIVGAVMQKYLQYKNEDKYITIEQEI